MTTPATPPATPGSSAANDTSLSPADAPAPNRRGPRRPYPPRQGKPWPEFPLTWHLRGYWFKKSPVTGRPVNYTADWRESHERYLKDKDRWDAEQLAPSEVDRGRHLVRDAINTFMERQQERFEDGEISDVQLGKYRVECEQFARSIGIETRLRRLCGDEGPVLFRKVKQEAVKRGLVVAERHIYYVRSMLDLANRRGLMPPANYAEAFDKPTSEQVARKRVEEEAQHGERAWTVEELREIVAGAARRSPHLFAQVMLGLNAGFGADDCALLRDAMIDRRLNLIRAHRGKTMRKRVAPLWPATLLAIDASRRLRTAPADAKHADRVFLTDNGLLVARKTRKDDDNGRVKRTGRTDSVRLAFDDMLEALQAEHDGTSPRHRVRRLIGAGYFDKPVKAPQAWAELRKLGVKDVGPKAVARACNELARSGELAVAGWKTFAAADGARPRLAAHYKSIDDESKAGRRLLFVRHKAGFYTLRAMFRSLAVGCGVDRDLISVIKGQKFDLPVDEYYLRGDLRAKLFDVVNHVYAELFGGWCSPWPHA